MRLKNLTITLLLPLLLISFLACADKPTTPDTLTEEEISALIDARVAEEIAKMDVEGDVLTPKEIGRIGLSTVYLDAKTATGNYYGSGFVVGEGLIATCYHVVKGLIGATAESVFDEKKHAVTAVLAYSKDHDLAIVKVEGFDAPPLPLGDSDSVEVGETIYVLGNPKKWKGTFSEGIISAKRNNSNFIVAEIFQITAATADGSSGSPVLNQKGEVIAIHSETELDAENLNFAVSVKHLKELLATLK